MTLLFYSSVILKYGERIFMNDIKQFIAPLHEERMQAYGQLIFGLVDKAMSSLSIIALFSAHYLATDRVV
jgi:hypothetical protein